MPGRHPGPPGAARAAVSVCAPPASDERSSHLGRRRTGRVAAPPSVGGRDDASAIRTDRVPGAARGAGAAAAGESPAVLRRARPPCRVARGGSTRNGGGGRGLRDGRGAGGGGGWGAHAGRSTLGGPDAARLRRGRAGVSAVWRAAAPARAAGGGCGDSADSCGTWGCRRRFRRRARRGRRRSRATTRSGDLRAVVGLARVDRHPAHRHGARSCAGWPEAYADAFGGPVRRVPAGALRCCEWLSPLLGGANPPVQVR